MMKRVVIVGCGGAGKSTLARQLGELTQLPVVHLDAVLWKPGWVMTDRANELSVQKYYVDQPEWIIDGNYGDTMNLRMAASDTIIVLDFPTWLCLWRVIKRTVRYYGRVRPDMGADCPERWDWEFIRWILFYRQIQRPKVLERLKHYAAGRSVFILKTPSDVANFLTERTHQQHSNA